MLRILSFLCLIVLLPSCSSTVSKPGTQNRGTDPQMVLDKNWQWVSTLTPVEKITVPAPERYTILLSETGRLQAQFDCNSGGGNYEISPGKLSFGPLLAIRMACPPDSLGYRFMQDLQQVKLFFMQGGELYLDLPMDGGTMRFRAAP